MERTGLLAHDVDVEVLKPDTERRDRITKTLAWLHSRGKSHSNCMASAVTAKPCTAQVSGLINFEIEGDAGGEDSQVQSLWLYQSFGGLPSKEYYEEAPILDLYQSVVAGMLTDIASNTHASSKHPKRDVFDDFLQELVEVEAEGWPWPWPGDDKGGDGGDDDGGKQPDAPGSKDEPLDKRMEKLAGKVVPIRKGAHAGRCGPRVPLQPAFRVQPIPSSKGVQGPPVPRHPGVPLDVCAEDLPREHHRHPPAVPQGCQPNRRGYARLRAIGILCHPSRDDLCGRSRTEDGGVGKRHAGSRRCSRVSRRVQRRTGRIRVSTGLMGSWDISLAGSLCTRRSRRKPKRRERTSSTVSDS